MSAPARAGGEKLSILVPAYNEAATLPELVARVLAVPLPAPREVLVVDDGSQDGTASALAAVADPALRLLRHETNRGKGAAIRTGLAAATGSVVVIQDADLEYDPEDIPALVEPILRGEADAVYGSRILRGGNRASYASFYWGGRLVSAWTNLLYGSSLTDEPTGYKAFRLELLRGLGLVCEGFEFCPEATAKLLRRGVSIREVPIRYRPRSLEEGKKITWRDGTVALWTLLRYRFWRG